MTGQISYNRDIPFATHNPSVDQPNMLKNTNAEITIWDRDHVTFNTNFSGTHKQVTFSSKNPGAAQVDPASVLFTNTLTSPVPASAKAELFYTNADATFLVNCVKAFGSFTSSATTPTLINSFNVVSVTFSSPNQVVTLAPGAVTGNNVVVLITVGNSGATTVVWTFANPVLNIQVGAGQVVSFAVLQA